MLGTFAGAQPFFNDAVAGTVVAVKSGMGFIFEMKLVNTTPATAYLQIFDVSQANVVLGTTVPAMVYRLAANESMNIQFTVPLELGRLKDGLAGISMAGTTTAGGNTGAAISVSATYQ